MDEIGIGDLVQPKWDIYAFNDFDCEMAYDEIGTVIEFAVPVGIEANEWVEVQTRDGDIRTVPVEALEVIKKYEPPVNDPSKYDRGLFD